MESVGIAVSICGITASYIIGYQALRYWEEYMERKKLEELLADYDHYDTDVFLECDDDDSYEGFSLMHSPEVDPTENEKIWLVVNYDEDE